jgi:hypothetical protein
VQGTVSAAISHATGVKPVANAGRPDLIAGARVRVVSGDAMAQLEMTGVAQSSARIGDRIQVRILAPDGNGEGRMEMAVVRSSELLELVEGR